MFPFRWHWAAYDMWALSWDRWGKLPHSLRIWGPGGHRVVFQRSDSPVGCYSKKFSKCQQRDWCGGPWWSKNTILIFAIRKAQRMLWLMPCPGSIQWKAKCINEVVLYKIFFLVCKLVVGVLHPRTCLSGSVPFCVCALFVLLIFCLSHPLSNVDKDYQVEFN